MKGFLMGAADIIPGVSGGTIALITGIYKRLVSAISSLSFESAIHLARRDYKRLKGDMKLWDVGLLVPLAIGIGLAFALLSGIIEHLLESRKAETFSFFIGLIIASAYFVFRRIRARSAGSAAFAALGFAASFIISGFAATEALGHSVPVIFISGAIASCAMILPGISGAFLLLLMGQYEHMLEALRSLYMPKIAAFIAGAAIGLAAFSRFLKWLLRKHMDPTMAFLTGMMLGSLRLPFIRIYTDASAPPVFLLASIALAAVAIVVIVEMAGKMHTGTA